MIQTTLAIFYREFSSYFNERLAYFVIPIFLLIVGGFSLFFQDIYSQQVLSLRVFFFWCAFAYVILIPAITMRSFAEETRTGSIELLMTLPISEEEMVLGKYLSSLALISLALLLTISYPIGFSYMGELDWGPIYGGYFGLFLLGAALSAIGIAASTLTRNQVSAFLLSFLFCVIPFALGFALRQVSVEYLYLVQFISFEYHFDHLAKGLIDSRDIVYYLSVCALFLHLAVFSLKIRRFR